VAAGEAVLNKVLTSPIKYLPFLNRTSDKNQHGVPVLTEKQIERTQNFARKTTYQEPG
jgi:hypothetical protein